MALYTYQQIFAQVLLHKYRYLGHEEAHVCTYEAILTMKCWSSNWKIISQALLHCNKPDRDDTALVEA